jgi:hypothetical protein
VEEFRSMVFANNPKLYEAMFAQEAEVSDDVIQAPEFEWVVPSDEGEALALMRELDQAMQDIPDEDAEGHESR